MKIRLVTVTWGSGFTDLFLRITARSLLAEGNVVALAARHEVAYTIHTTADDARLMRESLHFKRLAAAVTLELAIFDPAEIDTKDLAIHWMFWRRTAEVARRNGEMLFFIIPDMLFATGTLLRWAGFFEQGYRAVWTSVPQVVLETSLAEIEKRYPPAAQEAVSFDVHAVHRLLIQHLHPYMICMFRDSPRRLIHPEIVITEVPGQGMAMRAIASHLFCIDVSRFSTTDALSPIDNLELIAFDQCQGVCLERMLKHANLHYRPVQMNDMRLSNLGSWVDWFCSPADMLESYHGYRFVWPENADERAFRRADAALGFFAGQVRLTGAIYRVLRSLRGADCHRAAQIGAAAHYLGRLRRHWRIKGSVTVLVPDNAALARLEPIELEALLGEGNEKLLVDAVMAHIFPGAMTLKPGDSVARPAVEEGLVAKNGSRFRVMPRAPVAKVVAGPIVVDDCTIYVIDHLLAHPPLAVRRRAGGALPNRWSPNPRRTAFHAPAAVVPNTSTPAPAAPSVVPFPRRLLRSLVYRGYRAALLLPGLRRAAAMALSVYRAREHLRSVAAARAATGNETLVSTVALSTVAVSTVAPILAEPSDPVALEALRLVRNARVALNLAEILRFYADKMDALGAAFPPLRAIEDCLAAAGLSDERLVDELQRLVRDAPDFAEAWLELGYIHLDAGRLERAGECFDHSFAGRAFLPPDRAPCRALAAFGKAEVLEAHGRLTAAAQSLRGGLDLGKPPTMVSLAYARLLARLGRYHEALSEWEAGLDTDFTLVTLPGLPRDFGALAQELRARFGRPGRGERRPEPPIDAAAVPRRAGASRAGGQ